MELSDILLHLAEEENFSGTPGSPALYQTSNFVFDTVADMQRALKHENDIPFYSRGTNPTVQKLQQKMAALEETESCLVVASGSAAVSTAILGNVQHGDHVLSITKPYSWSAKLLNQLLPKMGIEVSFCAGESTEDFLSHVTARTKVIYLESPNSWTYEMQDLAAISAFAKAKGIITIIDNSYATPLLQKPATHGIDIMVHSATKYINGHSDVIAGIICGSEEMMTKLFQTTYMTLGPAISPFDAWLMLRSLRTLPMRIKHIGETTEQVLSYLENHPKIKNIYYPFAKDFAQSDLADKYLKGKGGLFTIDLNTDDEQRIVAFANSLKKFKLGCSWGSYESLAFPAMTVADSLNYDNPDIINERIRLSIGFDEASVLIADLEQALAKV
ncbi:MAG: cystathionine beta-lyase/cystathionine gamma-synthase [Cyclobacteriaceae bacterium]|jgi:cystathionine beta-lyase/cystathionine gamma-synthase